MFGSYKHPHFIEVVHILKQESDICSWNTAYYRIRNPVAYLEVLVSVGQWKGFLLYLISGDRKTKLSNKTNFVMTSLVDEKG